LRTIYIRNHTYHLASIFEKPHNIMALKATIYKANLQIADIDHHYYADHALIVARHPSETDERMMVRLLAFAICAHVNGGEGLELAKDLWEADEPALWQRDLTGAITQWIEVGQPF
jgi:uncharacterized protein YaeQ